MATIPREDTPKPWDDKPKQGRSHDPETRYNSRRWRKVRAYFLRSNPVCRCGRVAVVCDHITPVKQGGDFWGGPFQGLCKSCHASKSGKEAHGIFETPTKPKEADSDAETCDTKGKLPKKRKGLSNALKTQSKATG